MIYLCSKGSVCYVLPSLTEACCVQGYTHVLEHKLNFHSCNVGLTYAKESNQPGQSRDHNLIPGRGKEFLSSQTHPEKLWGPPRLKRNGGWVSSGNKVATAWSSPLTTTPTPPNAFMPCTVTTDNSWKLFSKTYKIIIVMHRGALRERDGLTFG